MNKGKVLISFIEHLCVGFCLYVDTTTRSFEVAKTSCTLATPKVKYSSNGMTLDIDPVDGLQVGETAWVGYTHDYEIFRYFGCVNYSLVHRPKKYSTMMQRNIGECQTFCEYSQYIGVAALDGGGALCKCINVTNPNFRSWLTSCGDDRTHSEFPFGGPYKFSIFQTVSSNVRRQLEQSRFWNDTSKNCLNLVSLPQSNAYQWGLCSDSQKVICFDEKKSQIRKTDSYLPWKRATEFCLDFNTVLMPYQEGSDIRDVFNPVYWTSNVRDYVISTIAGRPSATQKYGYIHRQTEDYFVLRFDQSSQPMKALCEDIQGSSRPNVIIPTTDSVTGSVYSKSKGISSGTAPNSKSLEPSNEPATSASSSESSSESNINHTTGEFTNRDSEVNGDSNVAVLVAVPVVIVLLTCGGLVGLFFWRKRKGKQNQPTYVNQNSRIHVPTNSGQSIEAEAERRTNELDTYHEIGAIHEPNRDTINDRIYNVLDSNEVLEEEHTYRELQTIDENKDTKNDGYNYINVTGLRLEEIGHSNNTFDDRDNTDATSRPNNTYLNV